MVSSSTSLALLLLSPGWAEGRLRPQTRPEVPDFSAEWRWADYDRTTGFQGRTVEEMVEVGDTIWVRTDAGIQWWAGFEWSRIGPGQGVPEGRATSLAPDGRGGVMIVVGGHVYQGGTEAFRSAHPPELARMGWKPIRAIPSELGLFLLVSRGTERAVMVRSGGTLRDATPPSGIDSEDRLFTTRSGKVWLTSRQGVLRATTSGWERALPRGDGNHRVPAMDETPDGRGVAFLTASIPHVGLWTWGPGRQPRRAAAEGKNAAVSVTVAPHGLLYAVYETGDVRVRVGGEWRTVELPATRNHGIHKIFATPSGNLWVASARGLHLYRSSLRRWGSFSLPFPDLRNRISALLLTREDVLWIGTGNGILRHAPPGPPAWIENARGTPLGVVTGLARDATGTVWITSGSSFEGAFLFRQGAWERFGPREGADVGRIHSVEVDGQGSVWLLSLGRASDGSGTGVFRYRDGDLVRWMDPEGWLQSRAYAFAEGPDGSRWFGTARGLLRQKGDEWSSWGTEEGVGADGPPRVFTLLPDPDGGAWFGYGPAYDMGLGRLDPQGTIRHLTVADGIPGNIVNEIRRDSLGVLWVTSDEGVGRMKDGVWAVLDGSTGLNPVRIWPITFSGPSVILGSVGGGVQVLNREEEDQPAPKVSILGPVSVEGRVIRVRWRAVAYEGAIPPERVMTRDRLDGGPWSEWGTYRELWTTGDHPFSWGGHRLEIQAKGLHGQLSEPVVAEFHIPFPLVLRPVFFLPVGGLTLALTSVLLVARRRRRESALALRASEQRLRTLVDSAPEAIAIYDVDEDHFVDANEKALALTGLTREEASGASLADLFPEAEPDGNALPPELLALVRRALDGEEINREWTLRSRGGPEIPAEIHLVRLPADGKRLVRFSLLDIRDRKEAERQQSELEEQLRQAQKLEAVGQLTGGVAHDFNNLLTVIIGNLDLLRSTRGSDPEVRDRVRESLDAAEKSALLTERLLAFSRRQTLDPRPVHLPDLVKDLQGLIARSLGETITIRTTFEAGLWPARADRGQLEHSLINLSVNARDAMPRGGVLHIRTSNIAVGGEMAESVNADPGDYVVLSVSDTGVGMGEETLSRAFDPFFTTKEVGRGSGLGLSMVYGFARQLGGFVTLESEKEHGTTVRLFLPRYREEEL